MATKANPAHRSKWDFAMDVIHGPTVKKILNVGHYHPVRAAQPGRAGAATASHDKVHEQLGFQSAQRLKAPKTVTGSTGIPLRTDGRS